MTSASSGRVRMMVRVPGIVRQAKARHLAAAVLSAEYACDAAAAARLREDLSKLDETETLLARAAARCEELVQYRDTPVAARDQVIAVRSGLQRSAEAMEALHGKRQAIAARLTGAARLEYEALRLWAGALTEDHVRALQAIAYRPSDAATGAESRTDSAPAGNGHGLWAVITRILRTIARTVVRGFRALLRRQASPGPGAISGPPGRAEEGDRGVPLPSGLQLPSSNLQPPTPGSITSAEAITLLERHRRFLTLRPLVEEASRLDADIDGESASARALESQARSLLRTAGIEEASLPSAFAAFDEACRKHGQLSRAEAAAQQAETRRTYLLAGRTREEMAAALAELESTCERRRVAAGAAFRTPGGAGQGRPDALARTLQSARQQKHAADLEAERLETEVRVALEGFRARAEIEEEAAHWAREVARLEKARAALHLARSTIEEAMKAVYRDFAPAVNTFLSEGIEAATDGRYRRAHVDPSTLRISLLVPETGLVAQDPPVSHGTRTLLYVLMRIGLAQHMSAIGEPVPLVLDDPFVDVDSRRLRRMLDFLLQLSVRMQVLLFTKDREIAAWFAESAPAGLHRLHTVSGVLSASTL